MRPVRRIPVRAVRLTSLSLLQTGSRYTIKAGAARRLSAGFPPARIFFFATSAAQRLDIPVGFGALQRGRICDHAIQRFEQVLRRRREAWALELPHLIGRELAEDAVEPRELKPRSPLARVFLEQSLILPARIDDVPLSPRVRGRSE